MPWAQGARSRPAVGSSPPGGTGPPGLRALLGSQLHLEARIQAIRWHTSHQGQLLAAEPVVVILPPPYQLAVGMSASVLSSRISPHRT